MSREVRPPVGNEQRDKFVVQVGLSACVGVKPVLDVGGVVAFGPLRHEGEPPVSLPLKIPEGPSHLFNSELDLLLVSFSSRLALRPLNAVEILAVRIGGCVVCRACPGGGLWVAGRGGYRHK